MQLHKPKKKYYWTVSVSQDCVTYYLCILVLISFKINVLHIYNLHTSVRFYSQLVARKCWTAFPATYCHLVTLTLLISISSSYFHHLHHLHTSLLIKWKVYFRPGTDWEHNDKYQEKPDSLPLEVVKIEREREREIQIQMYVIPGEERKGERTVSQCQNNWEPRAHISFVGAGLHFLMENILVLTLTPLERPSDPLQLKSEEKRRNDSFTYFTVT